MITYPLTIPGVIGPTEANLKKFDAVGESIGPFDGSAQQQQWQDQHWELDLVWPEMNWAQYAALDAFSGALHGKWGSFLWGPPLARAPRGAGSGTPVISGDHAIGSKRLFTTGWYVTDSPLLLPGDFFQFYTVPRSIRIVSVEEAGGFMFFTLAAPPPPALAVGTPVTLHDLSVESGLDPEFEVEVMAIAGNVLQFNITTDPYGATPETGYIAFDGGPIPLTRLYQNVGANPVLGRGSPAAYIEIWPTLREAVPDGTTITLANPQGLFRLAENRREAPARRNKTFTLQLKCREAL